MEFLGVDTAHRNLGLAVLTATPQGLAVEMVETFHPPEESVGVFAPALFCAKRVRTLLKERPQIAAACVEGSAMSGKHDMVSIGAVHGVVCLEVVTARVPFIYPTPNKAKAFFTGYGKAEKKDIKNKVAEVFGKVRRTLPSGRQGVTDNNQNDALMFAVMAYFFHVCLTEGLESALSRLPPAINREQALAMFVAEKPLNDKGKKPGILHRPNEFFWIPQEKREVLRVPV